MAVPAPQAPPKAAVSSAPMPPAAVNGNGAAKPAAVPLSRRPSTFSTGSNTPGDEQINRWIAEYVRRRDSVGTGAERGRGSDALPLHELKARIAHHYTNLVESIARRFSNSGEPFEDLVQEGFLGLLSALEHYDHVKGVKFSTYATHFVAGSIRHCLRDRGKIIKEPAWLHDLHGKIARTSDQLTQSLGRPPHPAEIAQTLNLAEESVEEILASRQVFQVAAFASSDGDGTENMAGLVDPEKIRSDKPQTLRLPIEDRIVLEETAQKLKKLEQEVLYEFFYKDLNQTEIAKKFGISCNYVSHILKNSTKKLKKMMGEVEVRERMGGGEAASVVDRVTGLYTQSHMTARLDEELSRAARAAQSVAALVIRLDGLPALAGHKRDEALAHFADAVRKSIRRRDIAGRFEENSLLVILPQTGTQADVVAERLENVLLASGAALHQRFFPRIGMAIYPENGRTGRDLLQIARTEAEMPVDERPTPVVPVG